MKRVIVLLVALSVLSVVGRAITPKLPVLYAPRFVKVNGQLGRDGTVGVEYDSRFKMGSNFGYNVGLGYGCLRVGEWYTEPFRFSPVRPYNEVKGRFSIVTVPLNVYYLHLMQGHSGFLEMSLGVNLFVTDFYYSAAKIKVGYFPSARLAYRYESLTHPGMFVVGANVNVRTPGSGLQNSVGLIPFLALGIRL